MKSNKIHLLIFLSGPCFNGYDVSADVNPATDATDFVPCTNSSSSAAAASTYVAAGEIIFVSILYLQSKLDRSMEAILYTVMLYFVVHM